MTTGIYQIRNKNTGWRYVGSASSIENRWSTHRAELRAGHHHNAILQRSWAKHGEAAFEFLVIEEVPQEALLIAEQHWIDLWWGDKLYNRRRDAASNLGVLHSDEAKAKMSAARRRTANSTARVTAQKSRSAKLRGRSHTDEHREKIRLGNLGKRNTEHSIEKMRQAARNRDKEHLAKIVDSLSQDWIVTAPTGQQIEVRNLNAWAKENDLQAAKLYAVARGERNHHKGYTARRALFLCASVITTL